jgi:hypothetical protein
VKQPSFLLRAAVVASSVLLVGLLVCYRAGAFNWLTAASVPRAVEPNLSDGPPSLTGSGDVPKAPTPTLLPGSKSFGPIDFVPGLSPQSAPTTAPPRFDFGDTFKVPPDVFDPPTPPSKAP